jgi:lysozyme
MVLNGGEMRKPKTRKRPSKLRLYLLLLAVVAVVFVFKDDILFFAEKAYRSLLPKDSTEWADASGKWGIDISHHQRHVDWQKLVDENKPDFIFLKSTEGSSHVDTKFHEYYRRSRKEGIPTGAYHFFSYRTDGFSQAQNYIRQTQLEAGDLYPVLDVEYRKKMKPKAWIVKEMKAFCREIRREYGVDPIIYCACNFYREYLKDDFSHYKLWICDYRREPVCGWVIWQYTETGPVKGIGKIDNNRLHKNVRINEIMLK